MYARLNDPITATGGVVGLQGTLAPEGAIVKVAGYEEPVIHAVRPAASTARRTLLRAVANGAYKDGEVLVIRYEGPKGGPGMREMLSTTAALYGQGVGDKVALITDGALLRRHARLLHRSRRPGSGCRRTHRTYQGRRHNFD